MAMIDTVKIVAKTIFKPSTAWVFLFFPALFYYMGTRLYSLGLFRSSTYGEILSHELIWMSTLSSTTNPSSSKEACSEFLSSNNNNNNNKHKLFYMQNNKDCKSLRYPLYLVHNNFDDSASIVATTWMEDEELGRGYLLLSTSAGSGKIYQWETGGGPIAIGRTLHLKDSGCRSNLYQKCSSSSSSSSIINSATTTANQMIPNHHTGSGGIVVDTYRSDSSPRLIVAEYGEGRVVRLEDNGARTPLVIETRSNSAVDVEEKDNNDIDNDNDNERLSRPFRLLVTPYGDLMIMDDATSTGRGNGFVLWRSPKASDVPALPSLSVSRQAHAWNRNNQTALPHIFFQSNEMGGMVLDPSGQRMYVTTMGDSSSVLVVSLSLLEDLDDDDDDDDENDESKKEGEQNKKKSDPIDSENNIAGAAKEERTSRELQSRQSTLVFDYTAYANAPGPIEVDNNGNIYLAVENGILVVSKSKSLVAKIAFSTDEKIVDLTLGSDKFLYIAMESKLARIRVPNSPLEVQKELLIKA